MIAMSVIVRRIDLELDDRYWTIVLRKIGKLEAQLATLTQEMGAIKYRVRVEYGLKTGVGGYQVDEKLMTDSVIAAHEKLYELCAEKRKKGYSLISDWGPPTSGLDVMLEMLP